MEWIVLAVVGAVIGTVVSFIATGLRMPQSLAILVAVVGAIAGGGIARTTGFMAFGTWTFYIAGAGLAIVMLAGGILGYSLTNEEKRV